MASIGLGQTLVVLSMVRGPLGDGDVQSRGASERLSLRAELRNLLAAPSESVYLVGRLPEFSCVRLAQKVLRKMHF